MEPKMKGRELGLKGTGSSSPLQNKGCFPCTSMQVYTACCGSILSLVQFLFCFVFVYGNVRNKLKENKN